MAITRFKNSSIANKGPKYDNALAGLPYIPIIGTATDGGNGTSASVAFTGNNVAGAGITYTALSTPGSFTGTGTTSPVTVTGLTAGTSYTFQVKAGNSLGDSAYSAASNSVTPVQPTAFESIATVNGTGSSATITFSNIPQTYQHLQIRCLMKGVQTGTDSFYTFSFIFNGDETTNGNWHWLRGTGSAVQASASINTGSQTVTAYPNSFSSWNNMFATSIIDIHDYASTTKNKTTRAFSGFDLNGGNPPGYVYLSSGLWTSTAAVTSISLFGGNNFTTSSTFALYGIKG